MLTVVITEKWNQSGVFVAYQIEYYSKGMMVGRVPCPKSLADAKANAARGLKLHGADEARITEQGKLVGVVKADA